MPIKIQSDLPVKEILEKENIFVMDETRAIHQDIRPIQILILNLMPLKEETELQLLRSLSNTPLQVDVSFMMVSTHVSKNTATSHLNKFYQTFEEVKTHNVFYKAFKFQCGSIITEMDAVTNKLWPISKFQCGSIITS